MKLLRTLILFDRGEISKSIDWQNIYRSYSDAIANIDFPEGTAALKLRKKHKRADGQWQRNGVKYLKARFFDDLTRVQGWQAEGMVNLNRKHHSQPVSLFPQGDEYSEPIKSRFGSFDFTTEAENGTRVAIEWETGNISSSHRSMNKLAISLQNGVIDSGVLIVPSRPLYEHLTDRIGNIDELSGYLTMWIGLGQSIKHGLLAISVVEHDELTNEPNHPYLPVGLDGRAREGRSKLR